MNKSSTHPADRFPLYTHERLLGVDIGVSQAQMMCEMKNMEYPMAGAREPVNVDAVGSEQRLSSKDRRYIASWARRNLFNGVSGSSTGEHTDD